MFKNLDPAILAAIIGGIFVLAAAFIAGILGVFQGTFSRSVSRSRRITVVVITVALAVFATALTYGLFRLFEPDPPLTPDQRAQTPVTSNAEWKPYITERNFSNATMVLVPTGCFLMGSNDGDTVEQPVNRQCFDKPFWIDKYEVTNAQYGSIGCADYSSESDQPRNCVTWFEARDFCEARNARLPTEAEWEYVARGPDDLVYPWGNDFIESNVVYRYNSNNQPAPVGSKPGGASWVGTMDMSGNLWEWVSSLHLDYPYRADDGRENMENTSYQRLVHGGAFYDYPSALLSSPRYGNDPDNSMPGFGFRCARDFEG